MWGGQHSIDRVIVMRGDSWWAPAMGVQGMLLGTWHTLMDSELGFCDSLHF